MKLIVNAALSEGEKHFDAIREGAFNLVLATGNSFTGEKKREAADETDDGMT